MLGNVWEWCKDFGSRYPTASMVNPTGPMTGKTRLLRGGFLYDFSDHCRASQRYFYTPDPIYYLFIGFRVVRTP